MYFEDYMYQIPPTLTAELQRLYYDKICPYKDGYLVERVPFHELSDVGYLWNSKGSLGPGPVPDFKDMRSGQLYGLHTYGGYYGFFRPDLSEVIGLLSTIIPPDELVFIRKIYVTTEMPDGRVYDFNTDRHRGVTTYHIDRKCA